MTNRRNPWKASRCTAILAAGSLFLVLLAGCVRNPATHRRHARLLSPEAERKIGETTKERILEQYKVLDNAAVRDYVRRVGERLAQVSDRPTVDYDFTVLDNDLINAFAAPGGFIFVTRGLLQEMNDEAELAMVLSHEIAHVAALHGVQMIQREMGQNALTVLGTIGAALVAGPEAMIMVANTADLFSSLYLLGYSRDKELEADNIGLQYLLRAGYDPHASLRFLRKLQAMDKETARGWDLYFRTHPNTTDRIGIIESMLGQAKKDEKRSNEAAFREIKALLPKVDPAERGRIEGREYRNRVHEIRLSVPSNWSLGFLHPNALVSFQTDDGVGEGRIQTVSLSSSTATADALAHQYAKDAGFQALHGRELLTQAGYGYLGRYAGLSPSGRLLDIRLLATVRRGKGYVIFCGAPPEKSDSYALDLEQIIRSFRFDPENSRAAN